MRLRIDADDRDALGYFALRGVAFFTLGVGGAATLGLAWRVFVAVAGI